MKKILLLPILIGVSFCSLSQTLYIPNGTNGIGTSANTNVGIGTSNAIAKLEIVSDNNFLRLRGTQIAANTSLDIINQGFQGITGAMNVAFRMGYPYSNGVDNGPKLDILKINNGNTVLATSESGSTLGQVGIGTSTPHAQLDIRGPSFRLSDIDIRYLSFSQDASGTPYGRAYSNTIAGARQFMISGWSHQPDNSGSTLKDILHFDGYNLFLLKDNGGNLGIGTVVPDAKLTVKGDVHAKEIRVDITGGTGPDYVFNNDYTLPSLDSVQSYINHNKHLPEVPSAKEMEVNGINLSEMNMLLLKKVEELTLYQIKSMERIKKLEEEIFKLKK